MQSDFARGGSLVFGVHYGRRNVVQGYEKFNYGKDKFTGNLDGRVVKEWGPGFFAGVNLDLRIIQYFLQGQ